MNKGKVIFLELCLNGLPALSHAIIGPTHIPARSLTLSRSAPLLANCPRGDQSTEKSKGGLQKVDQAHINNI